jgi:hypothetical protein
MAGPAVSFQMGKSGAEWVPGVSLDPFAHQPPEFIEVSVAMDEAESMVARTGGDQEVRSGHRDTLAAGRLGQLAGKSPNLGCRGNSLELLLQLAKQPLLLATLGAVPQLEAHKVAEHGPVIDSDRTDSRSDFRIAVRSERLDPGRGIDEEPLSRVQGSSRIRCNSSWFMNPSRVPNFAVSSWSRRRRLNSESAITTASRLVLAPVCRIASRSSSSGISKVVFMPSSLTQDGFHLKGLPESLLHPEWVPRRSRTASTSEKRGALPARGEVARILVPGAEN